MIACSGNDIAKMYAGTTIFEEVAFEIHEGDRVGLVGRNGSGKTTLFKLLAGIETPDKGQVHWKKGTRIGYLSQIPEYPEHFSGRDVLLQAFKELTVVERKMKECEQAMAEEKDASRLERYIAEYGVLQEQFAHGGGYEMEASLARVASGLKIEDLLSKSFSSLSGGEKTKVSLGFTLLQNPDFLLLDEPTNHLDIDAVEWLGVFLKEYDGTVIVVSHDRYFLDEIANRIFDLEDGELTSYQTGYSGFVKEKEERLLREFQQYEEQQKKIKKMKEAIKRLREWANQANPPNEGLHKRARSMERALERMEKLDRPILNRKKMNMELDSAQRSGKDVVVVKGASKHFGSQTLFEDAYLHIQFQERTAIVGSNGSGKSTLLKMILGEVPADAGEVRIGSNVKIGYLSQHIQPGSEDETVLEAFRNEVSVAEGEARNILAGFLFYGHAVFRRVSKLSGGEKMRLRLAQLMYQDINFLILDEPTNHLDIESREVLEEALQDYKGTILAVSHDRYFLNKLFTRISWIENRQLLTFAGSYDWAKGKKAEKKQASFTKEKLAKKKPAVHRAVQKVSSENPEQTEKDIMLIEAEISALDGRLEAEKDLSALQNMFREKEELEQRREELYRKLEECLS
ncbi:MULTISPECIES: ribosomal protection-like ABC-F family protein [Bacillus]|uniref:ABC transporter ATP-binding protein n=1 Tax=Bacillus infantis NRRL B-14911 TaxID=1367477 RepID=U5L4N9_9BACI|nr:MULTISPECIES: ABC-F type ribosomal protection protein [Bacillus]AGX02629.1 ABC transporter ATP-binding protein [Bacillus infantis NRRL B-14911]EAR64392.1 ABC transporter, ATP-binding protein [Bacillus sp. NRRL B-14911]PLR70624.1 ABC-F type ribosomal protection protein [Bacillus sp. UMB0728]RYI25731.1 ABC-F type ribosomal protection protein [Bacillus infantis]